MSKNNTPLISIIIPTFNRAALIGHTLDSVKNQTYTNWECIVVDDGSTDETENIIQNYVTNDERFSYYKRPDHFKKGGNGARNFGFTKSKGEFINWFDSDDLMLPDFLNDKISGFDSEEIDIVVCNAYAYYEETNTKKIMKISDNKDFYLGIITFRLQIVTNSVMFRKKFLENKELFDEKILRGQETDLLSRLFFQIKESKCLLIDKPLFLYRKHTETKTFANKSYNPEYSSSNMLINLKGLERNMKAGNIKLVRHYSSNLINQFFLDLENRNTKSVYNISNSLKNILSKEGKIYSVPFYSIMLLTIKIPQISFLAKPFLKFLSRL